MRTARTPLARRTANTDPGRGLPAAPRRPTGRSTGSPRPAPPATPPRSTRTRPPVTPERRHPAQGTTGTTTGIRPGGGRTCGGAGRPSRSEGR
ncbi:hypothetical protein FLX08_04825 [Microbispora hainanensis]|uniref:Uncharacterized protein n=1 Tax=Microbispora hainanensis TaxID=568844 RepID=A0A544Z2D0_9ACTN|nr:hypothetical protein FLX08_04825 [Microbispora hainanensis]